MQRQPENDKSLLTVPAAVKKLNGAEGQPLDSGTCARMEKAYAADFSQVRVHSDARAAESARELAAQAYTVGQNIVFGAGQYAPQTAHGQQLLAHELAHVIQPKNTGGRSLSQSRDASETEAAQAADSVSHGGSARPSVAGPAIGRQPLSGSPDLPPLTGSLSLLDNASPLLAAAMGSTTLDEFETGKAELTPSHQSQLSATVSNIQVLMRQYTLSTVTVSGHADTIGSEASNLALGSARAVAVKKALIDLGVPEAIISDDSKGEGLPQAVPTRNESANAKNRRVEVRFHPRKSSLPPLAPQLKPPTLGTGSPDEFSPPEKPPIELFPRKTIEPQDPRKLPPDFWKPIPPPVKGSEPQSALDVIGKKILDPVIDAVAGGLSADIRDKLKEGARSAVKSGVAKSARAAAEAAGITDPQGLEAIEKAVEAAIQEKGKSRP